MKDSSPFYISKRSKNGIVLFLVIALILVFTPRFLMWLSPDETFVISAEDIKTLKKEQVARKHYTSFSNSKKKSRYNLPPKAFDPNQYGQNDWVRLGLSKKQANVVLKFTERGIYSNEQLEKIFVIPAELFELIKDSTIYPAKTYQKEESKHSTYAKKEIVLIDVNNASQEELESIPGVGPFYAKNIIKYRDRLGGFVKKEQLLEVWKMDVEKYSLIEKYVKINGNVIQHITLNTVKVEQLKNHPYLNWNCANSIIKMRDAKGGFKKIEDIKESVLIDEELFEKIKPYLSL